MKKKTKLQKHNEGLKKIVKNPPKPRGKIKYGKIKRVKRT